MKYFIDEIHLFNHPNQKETSSYLYSFKDVYIETISIIRQYKTSFCLQYRIRILK